MILGIVSTIFSSLGIYGFFSGNLFLLYLGMTFVIIEHCVGLFSGQEKSLITVWFAFLVSFGMAAGGVNWFQALALCLCFEGTIGFVLGIALMLFCGALLYKKDNANNTSHFQDKENVIKNLMDRTGLSEIICTNCYDILLLAQYHSKEEAKKMIDDTLIPHLKQEQIMSNVGIALGMLVNDMLLTNDEAKELTVQTINEMINEKQMS